MKNKLLISIIMVFLSVSPCFADGGIPLWVMSAPTLFAFGLPEGIKGTLFTFILSLILLLFVSLIETFVSKFILKNINFIKLFKIMYKANLVSTIVGFLIVIAPIPFEKELLKEPLAYAIVGPWGKFFFYSLLLLNIILLVVSIIVEYYVSKIDLEKDYNKAEIKKSFLLANMTSYALPLIIYTIASISFGLYDIQENQYKKINVFDIDNIEITKPAFIPNPITKKECNSMKKQLGIKARCNMEKDYWAGAVATCGGVEHLLSEAQIDKLYNRIYTKDENGINKYNGLIASQYGFPRILPRNENNVAELILWTNKSGATTYDVEPIYVREYSKGHVVVHYFGKTKDDSNIYAICINNKNITDKKPKKKHLRYIKVW